MTVKRLCALVVVALFVSCERSDTTHGSGLPAPRSTALGDTTILTFDGDLPVAAYQQPVPVWTVAASRDDTTGFSRVYTAKVDMSGRSWLWDEASGQFFRVTADGVADGTFGRRGGGPGEFQQVNGLLALADGGMAVWDAENARVTMLAADGSFRYSFPVPGGFFTSNGLLGDRSGGMRIRRPIPRVGSALMGQALVRVDTAGQLSDTLLVPGDDGNNLPQYVASRKGATVSYYSALAAAPLWAWHPNGHFVWSDGGEYEIHFVDADGKPRRVRRVISPVPIDEQEREDEKARLTWMIRRSIPDWTFEGPAIPSVQPALHSLFSDTDGRIWARVAAPSIRKSDPDAPSSDVNAAPPSRFEWPNRWEVFSETGAFLTAVALPRGATIIDARGTDLWLLSSDDDGLPSLTRARIVIGPSRN